MLKAFQNLNLEIKCWKKVNVTEMDYEDKQ